MNPAGGSSALVGELLNEDAPLANLSSTKMWSDADVIIDHDFDIEQSYDVGRSGIADDTSVSDA